mgnify:CR=1 FL=1
MDRRITRRHKAPKTTELISFLKGKLDDRTIKVGDILYTNDEAMMIAPEGFRVPIARDILNTAARAGIFERVGRGQVLVTNALHDFSLRKILGIIKRRKRTENQRKKGEDKKLRHRRPQRKTLSVAEPSSSPEKKGVIATLVDECSLEELMSATHAKAQKMLHEEIVKNEESIIRLKRMKAESKRLGLLTP